MRSIQLAVCALPYLCEGYIQRPRRGASGPGRVARSTGSSAAARAAGTGYAIPLVESACVEWCGRW